MHGLYQLNDKICDQLAEYGQGELTMSNVDIIYKLVDIAKDLDEVIEHREEREEEYSGTYYDGMGGRRSYGRSYARQRDSRGRYSGDMNSRIDGMMSRDMDDRSREEWQRYADRMAR